MNITNYIFSNIMIPFSTLIIELVLTEAIAMNSRDSVSINMKRNLSANIPVIMFLILPMSKK